jgi:PilZ domain
MRRQERIELIYYLRLFDAGTNESYGHLVNVNPDGIMVIGERPLPTGETHTFTMDLPRHFGPQRQISFAAEIVWSRLPPDSQFYSSGLKLLSVSQQDRAVLARLMQDFDREEISFDIADEMNPPEISEGGGELS